MKAIALIAAFAATGAQAQTVTAENTVVGLMGQAIADTQNNVECARIMAILRDQPEAGNDVLILMAFINYAAGYGAGAGLDQRAALSDLIGKCTANPNLSLSEAAQLR